MANSLSYLVDNLDEELDKIKCKYQNGNKKCEKYGVKYKDCKCYHKSPNVKDQLLINKSSCCIRNYQKQFVKT